MLSDILLGPPSAEKVMRCPAAANSTNPTSTFQGHLADAHSVEDHRRQLDGLRFLAFLVVFVSHCGDKFPYGAYGVQLFFAISGFLITRILILHESGSLWHDLQVFYIRRILRIFPLYYGVLIVLLALGMLPHAAWQFLYIQNILMFLQGSAISPTHFWSLCVEEQFYLTYPIILLLTPRRARLHVLFLILFLGAAAHWLLDFWFPRNAMSFWLLPTSGNYLVWGCIAGFCDLRLSKSRALGTLIFCTGVLLLAACLYWGVADLYRTVPEAMLVGLAFGLMVFGLWRAHCRWLVSLLSLPAIAYLGKISYGLYVYHPLVLSVLICIRARIYFPGLGRTFPILAFLLTVIVASLSWQLFELPINNLKRRFPYARNRVLCLP